MSYNHSVIDSEHDAEYITHPKDKHKRHRDDIDPSQLETPRRVVSKYDFEIVIAGV